MPSQVTFMSVDLQKELDELVKSITTPKRSNIDVIANEMRLAIYENFDTESGDGQAWVPLAKSTVEEREFLGFPGTNPILIRTGRLFDSLINPNNADHVEEINVDLAGFTVDIGTLDSRARELNDGSGRIPARPFLTMDERQEKRLEDVIEAYFDALF